MSEIFQGPMVPRPIKYLSFNTLASFRFPNTNTLYRVYTFQRKTELRDRAVIDISKKALMLQYRYNGYFI